MHGHTFLPGATPELTADQGRVFFRFGPGFLAATFDHRAGPASIVDAEHECNRTNQNSDQENCRHRAWNMVMKQSQDAISPKRRRETCLPSSARVEPSY